MNFKHKMELALEQLIRHEFPNIKNLNISPDPNGDEFLITFDEGDYTKEQVKDRLEYIKNNPFDLSLLSLK